MAWRMGRGVAAAGVLAATLGAMLLVVGAAGQSPGLGMLLPGAAETGAPEWVRPGTRISWYAAGASIANADFQWQESENGTWEDPVTGKRYTQVDAPTAGGEGIFQLDVVAVDGTTVALQWTLLGLDRGAGRFFSGTVGGWAAPAAAPDDLWIHPDLLAAVPETDLPDLKLLRGPYAAADGATYAALGVLDPDPNAYSSQLFDLASGVLLSTTTRTQGNASPLHAVGQDPPEANSQLTIGRYLGTRQRDPAAWDLPRPDWARPGATLRYQGASTFVNPFDPTGPAQVWPVELVVTLADGGPTWASYTAASTQTIGGVAIPSAEVGIAGATGPWWIAPAALAVVQPGHVLDEDPVTTQRLTVEGIDPAAGTVTIASSLPGIASTSTYAADTGMLLGAWRSEPASGITTTIELVAGR
jgi:hypothetical protein